MEFRGNFNFLSNMYPCKVTDEYDLEYSCVESAYQAAKTDNPDERIPFTHMDGVTAKKAGRKLRLTSDWDSKKVDVMRTLLHKKFAEPNLMARLQAVHGEIVEDNTWYDTFWGRCRGTGQNMLGKLLMEIREEAKSTEMRPQEESMVQTGKIVITSIANIPKANAHTPLTEVWFVIRSLRRLNHVLPSVGNAKSYWVHPLSPSKELFYLYWHEKQQGNGNPDTFQTLYVPQFLQEMSTDFAKKYLNRLYLDVVKEGKTIALACFCQEESKCHRSILAGLMAGVGVEVINETGAKVDYSRYYGLYRANP